MPRKIIINPQRKPLFESALVVLIPEADGLVASFRERYTPSAAEGMPAHITINYPFQPSEPDREFTIDQLASLFSGFHSTQFSLTEICSSSDTLYLAVEPEQPFRKLIEAVADKYPESPPYGGIHDDVIPHVTVAEPKTESEFNSIIQEFALASVGKLPIKAWAREVWLMDHMGSRWIKRLPFQLAR